MTIKMGDIDVAAEIVDLHFQLRRTQKLLEIAMSRIPVMGGSILNAADITIAESDALTYVKSRFPNMGIEKKI